MPVYSIAQYREVSALPCPEVTHIPAQQPHYNGTTIPTEILHKIVAHAAGDGTSSQILGRLACTSVVFHDMCQPYLRKVERNLDALLFNLNSSIKNAKTTASDPNDRYYIIYDLDRYKVELKNKLYAGRSVNLNNPVTPIALHVMDLSLSLRDPAPHEITIKKIVPTLEDLISLPEYKRNEIRPLLENMPNFDEYRHFIDTLGQGKRKFLLASAPEALLTQREQTLIRLRKQAGNVAQALLSVALNPGKLIAPNLTHPVPAAMLNGALGVAYMAMLEKSIGAKQISLYAYLIGSLTWAFNSFTMPPPRFS